MAPPPFPEHTAVLQLLTGHYHEVSGYRAYREHGAGDWLLVHTIAGAGRFGHGGGELLTQAGDWTLLRPGTLHDYGVAPAASGWELLWAHFQPRPDWRQWLNWPRVHGGLMHMHVGGSAGRGPARALRRTHRLLHGSDRRREALAMNALELVLLRCDQHNPMHADDDGDARVRQAMDFLAQRLDTPTRVEDVAAAVGLSPSRLAHLFKQVSGETPQAVLETLRLQRAAELLTRTSFSIKQIAAAVGFDSPFYFSQRFKRRCGISPLGYRRRHAADGRSRSLAGPDFGRY